jgi:hypothetical protein
MMDSKIFPRKFAQIGNFLAHFWHTNVAFCKKKLQILNFVPFTKGAHILRTGLELVSVESSRSNLV